MEFFSAPWEFVLNEITKDCRVQKMQYKNLKSLSEIYEKLEPLMVFNLPNFCEIIIQRSNIDYDNMQTTRISIVNFEPEMSTEIFIKLIDAIFKKKVDFLDEVISVTFYKRVLNFSIFFEVKNFDNSRNGKILQNLDEFLQQFRQTPNEPKCSGEVSSFHRTQDPNGKKAISFKNTSDSIRNFLSKR